MSSYNKQVPSAAMVFAAGMGERMRPLTDHLPKPLIRVGGKTMLDRVLDKLCDRGTGRIVVNSHYKAAMIEAHIAARQQQDKQVHYTVTYEPQRLETGGGIIHALPYLGTAPIYAVNSDIIWLEGTSAPAFERLAAMWDEDTMDALFLLHPKQRAIGYGGPGDFSLAGNGQLIRPPAGERIYVFTGVQIIKPGIFKGREEKPCSFYRDILEPERLQEDGTLKRVYGLVHDGEWLHIGTPAELAEAEAFLAARAMG